LKANDQLEREQVNFMYDHGLKKFTRDTITGPNATATPTAPRTSERRGGERHVFTASAEVIELSSGARFTTRTTDIGQGGCFVDTMVPFPVGSKVLVSVTREKVTFEAMGKVVYAQIGLGMGIGFDPLNAEQHQALDTWLTELNWHPVDSREQMLDMTLQQQLAPGQSRDHAALVRLVRLMIGKRMLTDAEGSSILADPLL
jgi:hypothetical protein